VLLVRADLNYEEDLKNPAINQGKKVWELAQAEAVNANWEEWWNQMTGN